MTTLKNGCVANGVEGRFKNLKELNAGDFSLFSSPPPPIVYFINQARFLV